MGRLALAVPVAAVVLAGVATAGSYTPPPGDCCPQWSPKGTQIVFTANRGQGSVVGAVASAGGPEKLVPGIPVGVRSPDWTSVAYRKNGGLAVSKVDGTGEHVLASTNGDFAWSPDSKRLAFVAADGSLRTIAVDGSGLATLAVGPAGSPAWSPDDHLLAYVRTTGTQHVHVVRATGSGDATVEPGPRSDVSPVWSPDGTRLAYWSSDGRTALLKVVRIGGNGGSVRIRIAGAVTNGAIVWAPDGRAIFGAGSSGLVRIDLTIDLTTGKRRTLAGIPSAVFSPDGSLMTYAAGGECRDRVGIYVASADGRTRRRLTNSCTIYGTDGPDVIHADFSRVVFGLSGDDTLYADDTYYYFDGNSLYGGPGDDRLIGGYGQDRLSGGPGDDTLSGGPSADVLIGGPGHDHIDGGGGGDTIYARDGQRDRIACGKNGYDRRDRVYADRVDVVASDCEIVRRS